MTTDERTKQALRELATKEHRDFEESFNRAEEIEVWTQVGLISTEEEKVQKVLNLQSKIVKDDSNIIRPILTRPTQQLSSSSMTTVMEEISPSKSFQRKIIDRL